MFTLKGKNALITGSTQGIGLAVAKSYLANGARVVISGITDGQQVAEEIGALARTLNVTSGEQYKQVLQDVEQTIGKLDVLVLNAGIAEDAGLLEESPESYFDRSVAVNMKGVYLGLKYGPAHMNDGGSIIVTGSTAGSGITGPGMAEYAAAKAGAAYLARTAAVEFAPRGIRVNVVAPAAIQGTGMMDYQDGSPEVNFYKNLTAFGRMGKPEDLLGIYNFLASDASSFITGDEIRVDGGIAAGISLTVAERVSA